METKQRCYVFLSTIEEVEEERDEESASVCDGGCPMALQVKVDIPETIAGDMPPEPNNRQQVVDSPEWQE